MLKPVETIVRGGHWAHPPEQPQLASRSDSAPEIRLLASMVLKNVNDPLPKEFKPAPTPGASLEDMLLTRRCAA